MASRFKIDQTFLKKKKQVMRRASVTMFVLVCAITYKGRYELRRKK
jgi:hypothetical protein